MKEILAKYNHVLNYAIKLTGNLQYAEDLTQETYTKIIQKNGVKTDQNILGYLCVTLKNIFLDDIRKLKNIIFINEMPEIPQTTTIERINYKEIIKCEKQKQCIALYRMGYKMREIADIIELEHSTIRGIFFDIRKQLKTKAYEDITR